jgi:hypothetical protein
LFLPSFLVEVVPERDLLPTWVGCVAFVVWERKKEVPPAPKGIPRDDAIDVVGTPPRFASLPPPLPPAAPPARPLPPADSAVEKRLRSLNELRDKNLISPGEYETKRQQILSEL